MNEKEMQELLDDVYEMCKTCSEEDLPAFREFCATWLFAKRIDNTTAAGQTPLSLAVIATSSEYCSLLLEAGADPDVLVVDPTDETQQRKLTAFQLACRLENEPLLKVFLKSQAFGTNYTESVGFTWKTALGLLIQKARYDLAKMILDASSEWADLVMNGDPSILIGTILASPTVKPLADDNTTTQIATQSTDIINSFDTNEGEDPQAQALAFLQYIFQYEVDPNIIDEITGASALELAILHGKYEAAKMLVSAGVEKAGTFGNHAYFRCIPNQLQILQLLVEDDPYNVVPIRDSKGRSILHALILFTVVGTNSEGEPVERPDCSTFINCVQQLDSLGCPLDTTRQLMAGFSLNVFEEISAETQDLTPHLRAALEMLLQSANWNAFVVKHTDCLGDATTKFVEENQHNNPSTD